MSLASRVASLAQRIGQEIAAIHAKDSGVVTDSATVFKPLEGFVVSQFSARRSHGIAVIAMTLDGPFNRTAREPIGYLNPGWRSPGRVAGVIASQSAAVSELGSTMTTDNGLVTAQYPGTSASLAFIIALQ